MTNLTTTCLIANRGEIAVRVIYACREMGIRTTAVYTDVDANALHTQLADAAYPVESYLDANALIEIAQTAGCDCVHPGYGFLSESPDFARMVKDTGLTWIGPMPETIQQMGVKTEARALMQAVGVPLVPGFQSEDADTQTFIAEAEKIGYPIMVKAVGGGGGKGIRIVHSQGELADAMESAQREAQNAFGDARIFLEKYIEAGRHIEVQIIADAHGNVLHLFERECSTQRRHQKIVEETPSPLLDDDMRAMICQAAVDAAKAVNYVNAGTVEFIATSEAFYFLEMNTRLQVEHPVTELVTGVDLVQLQLRIAVGEPLPFEQADITQRGHAIECRIYAEDPHNQFLPSIGKVLRFIPPKGAGIRVDTGLQSGDEVTIHYDPMIAKLIVYGFTRDDAIRRMWWALHDMVILGVTTNIEFLIALLDAPAFINGEVHTAYVDQHLSELLPEQSEPDALALIALALSDQKQVTSQENNDPWQRKDGFRII